MTVWVKWYIMMLFQQSGLKWDMIMTNAIGIWAHSLVDCSMCFGGTRYLHFDSRYILNMEAAYFFKTLITIYQTMQHHILGDSCLCSHHCRFSQIGRLLWWLGSSEETQTSVSRDMGWVPPKNRFSALLLQLPARYRSQKQRDFKC